MRSQVAERPTTDARTVLISTNPRAGRRWRHDHIEGVQRLLQQAGYHVRSTTDLAELRAAAIEAQEAGALRAVVAVGGDGTASIVRNHVPLEVPLVIVPMGTENLLGRYLAQSPRPDAICRTLDEGVTIGLDLGRAAEKHFLLMFSAGFDAAVVRALHEARRGNIHRSAYLWAILRAMRSYDFPEMQLYCGDQSFHDKPLHCRWLFGFNLPLYALGLRISPDAVATDGLLDVCTFGRGMGWSVIRYLWHVKRGTHSGLLDTTMLRSQSFRVEAPAAKNVAYQLDGDIGGELPVDVAVLPGALRLLVPQVTAKRLGFALPIEASVFTG